MNNETPNSYDVENAGLIIIWPFISTLFSAAGLLRENLFIDLDNQYHAANLLEFIATGAENLQPARLALNKILCEIDQELLLTHRNIAAAEKKLVEDLLNNVLLRWQKLQNTSVGGLRESFLMREGKLIDNGHQWSLIVSRKSYDMLLATLPWGLEIVKLPWMSKPVHVTWD